VAFAADRSVLRPLSVGSGGRRDTLRLPSLLLRPGAAATVYAPYMRLLLVLLYSQFGD